MRLKKVSRTAAVAWSPGQHLPILATGTVAGALDATFSSSTELELFDLNSEDGPVSSLHKLTSVTVNARCNRLAWGAYSSSSHKHGIIAAGKENGELDLWSPSLLLNNNHKEALLLRTAAHSGPVRGLDMNPNQSNLLASGATDGELYIWDLTNPSKPYSPGARSQRLEDVTCLSWNRQVPHILATASNNGYTVVWDLRSKRELIKIAYPGGRRPITGLAWNPDAPTELVTVADDDQNPLVMVWNLRNASAAEKSLVGHTKGILSVDWCPKDSDLLLTCGKDNRTIVWDVNNGYALGDLSVAGNWVYDVKWYGRNPDLSVTASYDGSVVVHSLLSTSDQIDDPLSPRHLPAVPDDKDDPFSQIAVAETPRERIIQPNFTLPHPPKWFRRPCGASFGFGNKMVSFDSSSRVVKFDSVRTGDETLADQVERLSQVLSSSDPNAFGQFAAELAQIESDPKDKETWTFLASLFSESSRDEILHLFGFDRTKLVEDRLEPLFQKLNISIRIDGHQEQLQSPSNGVNGVSPIHEKKATPFSLYASGKVTEDSDIDTIITKAVLLGDFETAVNVCIKANRFADALVLAVNGGEDLLYYTQKAYFSKSATQKPYARILQSIVEGDLTAIVQNVRLDGANAAHWKDLLALVCTYASADDFAALLATLGERLEVSKPTTASDLEKDHAASLCYVGAGVFDRAVKGWITKARHNESLIKPDPKKGSNSTSAITHRLVNLATVLRQAIAFDDADLARPVEIPVEFHEDGTTVEPDVVPFPLAALYDRYLEYAEYLANLGKLSISYRFFELVPEAYIHQCIKDESKKEAIQLLRDRVYQGGGYALAIGPAPKAPFLVMNVNDGYAQQQPPAQQYGYQNAQSPPVNTSFQPQQQQNSFQQSYPAYPGYSAAAGTPSWAPPSGNLTNKNPYAPQPPPINTFQPPPMTPPVQQSWNQPSQPSHFQPPPMHMSNGSLNTYPSANQPYTNSGPGVPPTGPPPRKASIQPELSKPVTGDRSKIQPAQKPCFDAFSRHLDQLKSKSDSPSAKKTVEDVDKRIQHMFDDMNAGSIPRDVSDKLLSISQALDRSDFNQAHHLQTELMTKRFDVTGPWIVGIKRLVDSIEKAQAGTLNSPPPERKPSLIPPSPGTHGLSSPPAQVNGPPPIRPAAFAPPPTAFPGFQPPQINGPGPSQPPLGPPPMGAPPVNAPTNRPPPPPTGFNSRPPTSIPTGPPLSRPPTPFQNPPPVGPPGPGSRPPPPSQFMPPPGPPPTGFQQAPPRPGPPPTGFQQPPRPGPPPTGYQPSPPPSFNAPPQNTMGRPVGPPPMGPPPVQPGQYGAPPMGRPPMGYPPQ